ncbi:MAG: branched-chain amino acid transaminase [Candidatus Pacearchaeota archaeon]
MEKTKYIWLNGKFVKWQQAKIHVLSHALHYGSAVFEGIRLYNTIKGPAIFRLNEHIERLFNSAKVFSMRIPFSKKDIKNAIIKLVKVNKINQGYIRPIVFYGYGKMGLNPEGAELNIAIAVWPWGKYLKEKVKVIVSDFIRLHPQSVISTAKVSGYYVNSIFATMEAKKKKYDEAILLDFRGYVAEGPGENIFIVKKNTLYTPKPGSILLGITRDSVIKIAKDLGIKTFEKDISVKELLNADEAFFTGTAAEITPIFKIDKKLINKGKIGPITQKIKETFEKIVRAELKNYYKWLTFVK